MKVDYNVDEELSKFYSTTEDTINQTVTHLKSKEEILCFMEIQELVRLLWLTYY